MNFHHHLPPEAACYQTIHPFLLHANWDLPPCRLLDKYHWSRRTKLNPSLVALEVAPHPSHSVSGGGSGILAASSSSRLSSFFFFNFIKSFPARFRVCHRTTTFTARTTWSNTVFIHPSLTDVLSPDLWILGRTVWFEIRRSAHDAIQSVFAVAVTLRQPIDRSAVPDSRESPEQNVHLSTQFCQPRLPAPTVVRHDSRDVHSACSEPAHQTCRCHHCGTSQRSS